MAEALSSLCPVQRRIASAHLYAFGNEYVDVCRFLLIGDCRKKLLRTPYFFGWHYAVLTLNIVSIFLISLAVTGAILQQKDNKRRRITAILYTGLVCMSVFILCISLMVFVINGEMLESRYLIGVKNTFEKYYGYSFYLACAALLLLVCAAFGATVMTTFAFFGTNTFNDVYCNVSSRTIQDHKNDVIKNSQEFRTVSVQHGDYITSHRSSSGQFQQTTRHFYSY
ncbi:hypothetical protein RB195_022674 [Necator americanus]|uniref:Clc-like protein n=1 Tax=Necator americanus TaxID=51031 RepID=A0ABR1EGE5_NECAM